MIRPAVATQPELRTSAAARLLRARPLLPGLALVLPALALVLLALTMVSPARGADHAVPPPKDAGTYPAFDEHAADHITIAADPYDTSSKVSTFRVDYLKYGILPVRVIVTNAGDRPISLNQVRIHLVPSQGDRIEAAEPEDVERRVATRDRVGTTIPIGPIRWHRGGSASDAKVEQDFSEHEYAALAVEPHTTRAGFLFYDVEGLGKQPLKGAKLVVRRVADADGKELFYFEIPFDKYLSAIK